MRDFQKHRTNGWMFLLIVLFIGGFAHVVAQELIAEKPPETLLTETPVQAPVAIIPTEILIVATEIVPVPNEPIEVPPTPVPDIPVLEPTLIPTFVTPSEPTLAPIIPTDQPAEMPPTSIIPTDAWVEASPTALPTQPLIELPQSTASISLVTNAVRLPQNATLAIAFAVQNLSGVYTVSIICQTDPAFLQGIQSLPGELTAAGQRVITDSGFLADGQWMLRLSHSDSAAEAIESGMLWSLNYQVMASGLVQIVCQAQLTDLNGQSMPLAGSQMYVMIEGYDEELPPIDPALVTVAPSEPTIEPSLESSPTVEADIDPEATPIVEETDLTPTPDVEMTPESEPVTPAIDATVIAPTPETGIPMSHLSGHIELSYPSLQAVVIVTGAAGQQMVAVETDGSFAIDIPIGRYQITFSAAYHLPYSLEGFISEQPVTLSTITLLNGDVDENGVIDVVDGLLLIRNFGLNAPNAMPGTDLNGDGTVNIYDLAIFSANARLES